MLKLAKALSLVFCGIIFATSAHAEKFKLGREALPVEVSAWNIDVRPDGQGLPEGEGSVLLGEEIFMDQCAACHGEFGEGAGRWPILAGGADTLQSNDPVKTIGSYWPYLSTVYDYVKRAMPFGNARSLSDDEVYSIVAYLLYLNDLMDEDGTLSKESFTTIHLPNEAGFTEDTRPSSPITMNTTEPCMKNCKETVEITKRARFVNVTPDGQ